MPPSALTLHILLALAVRELDPPGIYLQMADDTQSGVIAHERSFYKAIHRLEDEGYIDKIEFTSRYAITKRGRAVLAREKVRFGRTTTILHQRA